MRFLLVACLSLFAAVAVAEEPAAARLFDGKTFKGWEGDLKVFRIHEYSMVLPDRITIFRKAILAMDVYNRGANPGLAVNFNTIGRYQVIAGSLERNNPRNEFLCTEREYGDFELTLKFKVLGKGANAGIQIRSRRIPDHHEMIGYQADLGDNYWGCLYDESRRKTMLATADAKAVAEVLKRDDWNEYRIRCEGKRIQLWINGLKTVDYTEPDADIEQRGLIGLQIHGGPPSEAWYKDITLREIRK